MSRILIFAEAVTLAHVARPIALSRILRGLGHDVAIASAPAAHHWLAAEPVEALSIGSIDPKQFLRALDNGTPAYSPSTFKHYVQDDLQAISGWRPDIVLGDFRLSLYISCKLARKPYGNLTNAYWSPQYWPGVELPSLRPLRWLGSTVGGVLFRSVHRIAFALHATSFRRACKYFGVAPLSLDLREVYTRSDATAFADASEFYEPAGRNEGRFLGPLFWAPAGTWPRLTGDATPIVFVSLGSSGSSATLKRVAMALDRLPVRYIVATGGGDVRLPESPNRIHEAAFVPYAEGCRVASLVICNGGSPATYQALAEGKPWLALPMNLDQFLNTRILARVNAGETLRADSAGVAAIGRSVEAVLRQRNYRSAAAAARDTLKRYDQASRVAAWIDAL